MNIKKTCVMIMLFYSMSVKAADMPTESASVGEWKRLAEHFSQGFDLDNLPLNKKMNSVLLHIRYRMEAQDKVNKSLELQNQQSAENIVKFTDKFAKGFEIQQKNNDWFIEHIEKLLESDKQHTKKYTSIELIMDGFHNDISALKQHVQLLTETIAKPVHDAEKPVLTLNDIAGQKDNHLISLCESMEISHGKHDDLIRKLKERVLEQDKRSSEQENRIKLLSAELVSQRSELLELRQIVLKRGKKIPALRSVPDDEYESTSECYSPRSRTDSLQGLIGSPTVGSINSAPQIALQIKSAPSSPRNYSTDDTDETEAGSPFRNKRHSSGSLPTEIPVVDLSSLGLADNASETGSDLYEPEDEDDGRPIALNTKTAPPLEILLNARTGLWDGEDGDQPIALQPKHHSKNSWKRYFSDFTSLSDEDSVGDDEDHPETDSDTDSDSEIEPSTDEYVESWTIDDAIGRVESPKPRTLGTTTQAQKMSSRKKKSFHRKDDKKPAKK